MMRRELLVSVPACALVVSASPVLAASAPCVDRLATAVAGLKRANAAFNAADDPTGSLDTAAHRFWRGEWQRYEEDIEALPIRSPADLGAYCEYLQEMVGTFKIAPQDLQKIRDWAIL